MSNKSILFADDSATMRTIVEKTFSAEPFDVTVVPSGEAAIKTAREIQPDVIIADAGMAGVSGYDVCRAIREDTALETTPFLIMSGVSNPYDNARGMEVGIDEFMKKPFDTSQLIETVTTLASRSRSAPVASAPQPAKGFKAPMATSERITARPASSPISVPSTKRTMEFGATAHKYGPDSASMTKPEPSVPIDLHKPVEKETFQVATLAEMAQIDEEGAPIQSDVASDAIDMPQSALSQESQAISDQPPAPKGKPSTALPIAEAVQRRAKIATVEIEKGVDGLTPDQVEAIRVLTTEVIERVVWEIVPELAETIIKEEIAKLLEE